MRIGPVSILSTLVFKLCGFDDTKAQSCNLLYVHSILPCWQVCAPQSIPDLAKFARNHMVSHHPCSFVCLYTLVADFIRIALQPALATAPLPTVKLPKTTFICSSPIQRRSFEYSQAWLLKASYVLVLSVMCLLAKPVRRDDLDQNHLLRWFGWM